MVGAAAADLMAGVCGGIGISRSIDHGGGGGGGG